MTAAASIAATALLTRHELFDYQIEELKARNLAAYIDADPFRNKIPGRGSFLFVPPPQIEPDLNALMGMVELDGKRGASYFSASMLVNMNVPSTASLLTGVQRGAGRLDTRPSVSRMNILNEGKHPYTVWRMITYAILFPWILKELNHFDLVGSRVDDKKGSHFPYMFLSGGRPVLNYDHDDDPYPQGGAPSCESVLVP